MAIEGNRKSKSACTCSTSTSIRLLLACAAVPLLLVLYVGQGTSADERDTFINTAFRHVQRPFSGALSGFLASSSDAGATSGPYGTLSLQRTFQLPEPTPDDGSVLQGWQAAFGPQASVQVMVHASGDVAALGQVLSQLQATAFAGLPPLHLRVCVAESDVADHTELQGVVQNATWSHGTVDLRFAREGSEAGVWQACWADGGGGVRAGGRAEAELGVMFEEGVVLSRHWAKWLVMAATQYRAHANVTSFSLLQPVLLTVDSLGNATDHTPLGSLAFGHQAFKLTGSAMLRETWAAFSQWRKVDRPAPGQGGRGLLATSLQSQWEAFCLEAGSFALAANLGHGLRWAVTGNATDERVVPFWRREYGALPDKPVLLAQNLTLAAHSPRHADAEVIALAALVKEASPPGPAGFAGIIIMNAGYAQMTLSWLCNTADMPGAHERTIIVCTDQLCLSLLRTEPRAAKLFAVVGIDLFRRADDVPGASKFATRTNQAQTLLYASPNYVLMMVARTKFLTQLVEHGASYLLFETDALWTQSAYDWIDAALESGHVGIFNASADRTPDQPPFDFVGYVDVQPDKLGGGFFLAMATPSTVTFFRDWTAAVDKQMARLGVVEGRPAGTVSDQVQLQNMFRERVKQGGMAYFPTKVFPSGQWYDGRRPKEGGLHNAKDQGVVVLQFNWIMGNDRKIRRAKQYRHWFLSEDGTCLPPQVPQ